MSRIAATFERLRGQGRAALIPYMTAGDPDPDVTAPLMHALVSAGADIVELGVPFSDPMADGPVIQAACERALRHHVSLHKVLEMVRRFRAEDADTPVVLMGYLNPIEAIGYEPFAEEAAAAGVDGILTVDLPPEEAHDLVQALKARALDPIFLIAPTSGPERIRAITAAASGFVYYVSLKGVTGASTLDPASVRAKLSEIRSVTDLPVGVGFGIKDGPTAGAIAGMADAVVVGSAIVRHFAEHADAPQALEAAVTGLLREMRSAIDAAGGKSAAVRA
jgi:tryptophan synthase alpha chain